MTRKINEPCEIEMDFICDLFCKNSSELTKKEIQSKWENSGLWDGKGVTETLFYSLKELLTIGILTRRKVGTPYMWKAA